MKLALHWPQSCGEGGEGRQDGRVKRTVELQQGGLLQLGAEGCRAEAKEQRRNRGRSSPPPPTFCCWQVKPDLFSSVQAPLAGAGAEGAGAEGWPGAGLPLAGLGEPAEGAGAPGWPAAPPPQRPQVRAQ